MKLFFIKKDLIFNFFFSVDFLCYKLKRYMVFKFNNSKFLNHQYIFILFKNLFFVKKKIIFLRNSHLKLLIASFKKSLIGICCGYFTRFNLLGYNYRLKSSFSSSYLLIFLGHCYSVLVKFPSTVKIFKKKRSFIIFSTNLIDFNFTVFYLRHLRDLYPYKIRGLSIENEAVNLKKGKKSKVR